jgi:indole-3-glycerol phosphate synthase
MTILEKIILEKQKEVDLLKGRLTISDLERQKFFAVETRSLSKFIRDPGRSGIIAEFKRRSPSKGTINSEADISKVTTGYSGNGASGLSVLTDQVFFGGTCSDLTLTREINDIPVLRKDFIIDEFQVIESKAVGADAILLIASALDTRRTSELAALARSLKMEVLLEIHSASELGSITSNSDIIGVNNRDLDTFKVDINVSLDLINKIPGQFVRISESGLSDPSTVRKLRNEGFDGFLIGELFMADRDPVSAFDRFVKQIR